MQLLRQYRAWQSGEMLRLGEYYRRQGFVFSQDNGAPMHPDGVTDWLAKFSKRHGLPHINPHAFRHPYVKHTTKNIILKSRKPKLPILVLIVWVFCFCFLFYDFARSIGGIISIISFKDYFCCSTAFFTAEI